MDYGNLIQLTNPGQDPFGPISFNRVQRWKQLNDMQQASMQKGMGLADLNAQQEEQKVREYMAGAPGRMDSITLANMNASDAIKPDEIAARKRSEALERAAKDKKFQDAVSGHMEILGPASDAFTSVQDPNQRKQILKQLEGLEITAPNGKPYRMGSDPERDGIIMEMVGIARKNEPKLQNKVAVEEKKGQTRLALENIKSLNAKELAILRGEISSKIQSQRDNAADARSKNKPPSLGAAVAARLDARYGDDHGKWLEAYNTLEQADKLFGADAKAAILKELGVNVPQNTETRPLPEPNKPKNQKEPEIGNKWDTEVNGKRVTRTITNVGRDPKTKQIIKLQLDDGSVVDYK